MSHGPLQEGRDATEAIFQAIVPGIVMGSVYALLSVGLTVIFGVLRIVNFAHGEFLMLAMYSTLFLTQRLHVSPYALLPLNFVLFLALGMLIQRALIRSVLAAEESVHILITIGLLLVFENGALMLWKSDYRSLQTPYLNTNLHLPLGASVNLAQLLALAVSVAVIVLLGIFLGRTRMGTAIRALAQDREAARLLGINAARLDTFTFGLGTAVAAVGGTALAVFFPIYPLVGLDFILKAFVIVVLGGMGSIGGSLAGGLVIGVLESLTASFLPGGWDTLIVYLLFVLVLLLRPQGLFGRVATR